MQICLANYINNSHLFGKKLYLFSWNEFELWIPISIIRCTMVAHSAQPNSIRMWLIWQRTVVSWHRTQFCIPPFHMNRKRYLPTCGWICWVRFNRCGWLRREAEGGNQFHSWIIIVTLFSDAAAAGGITSDSLAVDKMESELISGRTSCNAGGRWNEGLILCVRTVWSNRDGWVVKFTSIESYP